MTESEKIKISDAALTQIAAHCALAGLCPLIPVPFVDDMIIRRIHRRLCTKLAAQNDIRLSPAASKLLTERESEFLAGAVRGLLLWPVKKILKKVFFIWAIKSCADVAAAVFHEGWLLARVFEQDYVPDQAVFEGDIQLLTKLRNAVVDARDRVDPDATRQVMLSAFGVGGHLLKPVLQALKGALASGSDESRLDAAEREASPIADRIRDEMKQHWAKAPELEAALLTALEKQGLYGS